MEILKLLLLLLLFFSKSSCIQNTADTYIYDDQPFDSDLDNTQYLLYKAGYFTTSGNEYYVKQYGIVYEPDGTVILFNN